MDDPDAQVAPLLPRVAAAELTMQVLYENEWHRRTPDLAETACGEPIRLVVTPMRREALTELATDRAPPARMCSKCFTPHELAKARREDAARLAAEDAAQQRWLDEAPQREAEREARAAEREARATLPTARHRRHTKPGDR